MVKAVIKVICGGCGIKYTDANGNERHALKTPESGPFECEIEQAKRLVDLRVAEYVNELGWQKEADPAPQIDGQQEGQADGSQETEKASGHLDAETLETWDYNDLKKLAAEMGVEPEGKKRADYIAAIVAAEVEPGDEDDGDEMPELSAADPE